jgi:hypothetical protein
MTDLEKEVRSKIMDALNGVPGSFADASTASIKAVFDWLGSRTSENVDSRAFIEGVRKEALGEEPDGSNG